VLKADHATSALTRTTAANRSEPRTSRSHRPNPGLTLNHALRLRWINDHTRNPPTTTGLSSTIRNMTAPVLGPSDITLLPTNSSTTANCNASKPNMLTAARRTVRGFAGPTATAFVGSGIAAFVGSEVGATGALNEASASTWRIQSNSAHVPHAGNKPSGARTEKWLKKDASDVAVAPLAINARGTQRSATSPKARPAK
jgi:hypothetical protein